jgi:peptide/nickel transport system permease protein
MGGLMLLLDIWMAFPSSVLAIALSATFGAGLSNLILALVLTGWVSYCRVIRGEVLSLRPREFVMAARVIGATETRIVVRPWVPSLIAPSGGSMLSDGRQFLRQAWWLATFPGLAISALVLAMNLLGDGLRDALEPCLRGPLAVLGELPEGPRPHLCSSR